MLLGSSRGVRNVWTSHGRCSYYCYVSRVLDSSPFPLWPTTMGTSSHDPHDSELPTKLLAGTSPSYPTEKNVVSNQRSQATHSHIVIQMAMRDIAFYRRSVTQHELSVRLTVDLNVDCVSNVTKYNNSFQSTVADACFT